MTHFSDTLTPFSPLSPLGMLFGEYLTPSPNKYEIVRLSDAKGVSDIVALGKKMHKEHKPDEPFDWDVCIEFASRVAADDTGSTAAWILYRYGLPIGFIVGNLSKRFSTSGVDANHSLWYVIPSARRYGKAAVLLWKTFEQWAHDNKARSINSTVSLHNAADMDRRVKLIKKLGYRVDGYMLTKELEHG